MTKIQLTADEIEVIRQQLNGEIGGFTATPKQVQLLNGVIGRALALLKELDEYDTMGEDLIQWYWDKYQAQESESKAQ